MNSAFFRGHSAGGQDVYVLQSRRQDLRDGKDYTQQSWAGPAIDVVRCGGGDRGAVGQVPASASDGGVPVGRLVQVFR